MIASKPYVFPPRIMFSSLKIIQILFVTISLFLKTDVMVCTVLFPMKQSDKDVFYSVPQIEEYP